MTSTGSPYDANALAGDFGEYWLHVVASGCDLLHGPSTSLDLEKADVQLTLREVVGNTYNPRLLAQVKTSINTLPIDEDGAMAYDLDVATYNVLRREDHSTRLVLVVIEVSEPADRVRLEEAGTLLVGRGAWVSLEGHPATTNAETIRIHLPSSNTLDGPGLRHMLVTYGVRSTTSVPTIDPWKESA